MRTLITGENKNCLLRKAIRIILYQPLAFLSTIILRFFAFFYPGGLPTTAGTTFGANLCQNTSFRANFGTLGRFRDKSPPKNGGRRAAAGIFTPPYALPYSFSTISYPNNRARTSGLHVCFRKNTKKTAFSRLTFSFESRYRCTDCKCNAAQENGCRERNSRVITILLSVGSAGKKSSLRPFKQHSGQLRNRYRHVGFQPVLD